MISNCPNCEIDLPRTNLKFCPECGYQLIRQGSIEPSAALPVNPINSKSNTCTCCHKSISATAEKCSYCGNPNPKHIPNVLKNKLKILIFSILSIYGCYIIASELFADNPKTAQQQQTPANTPQSTPQVIQVIAPVKTPQNTKADPIELARQQLQNRFNEDERKQIFFEYLSVKSRMNENIVSDTMKQVSTINKSDIDKIREAWAQSDFEIKKQLQVIARGITAKYEITFDQLQCILSESQEKQWPSPTPLPTQEPSWNTVKYWQGNASKNTESFRISGSQWAIQWRSLPDSENRGGHFSIFICNADTNKKLELAVNRIEPGSDISYFRIKGHFYLEISGDDHPWQVQVSEEK